MTGTPKIDPKNECPWVCGPVSCTPSDTTCHVSQVVAAVAAASASSESARTAPACVPDRCLFRHAGMTRTDNKTNKPLKASPLVVT